MNGRCPKCRASLAGAVGRSHRCLSPADRRYRAFHRCEPSRVVKVRCSRLIPPVVVDLGELVGVIYRCDKEQAGRPQTYLHRMETPPRLVSNVEGTQLYVVGGRYRVTARGIEG